MKGLAESSLFHQLTNPHVINRFIFGHGYLFTIYIACEVGADEPMGSNIFPNY